jgi:hypothetical protein
MLIVFSNLALDGLKALNPPSLVGMRAMFPRIVITLRY